MSNIIRGKIDNIEVAVAAGTTILDAARQVQVKIPTLCKHKDLLPTAACGLCIVHIKGSPKLPRACATPFENGMEVITQSNELQQVRKTTLELILSTHPNECLSCGRNTTCELQQITADFGIHSDSIVRKVRDLPLDDSTNALVLDPRKCIKCGRCIDVCQKNQNVWALSFLERGIQTRMAPAGDIQLADSPCIHCGQCSAHCPTGAIIEKDEVSAVWSNLYDTEKHCVVQIAPAVRVALGEAFGLAPGVDLTGKIYTALKRLGFKAVFDTNFSADLTIMEEASEFVERFAHQKGPLPLITSCCPAWTEFMEEYHYDFIDNFSTAKSPQQMLGVMAKTYYAEKNNLDPSKMYVVSIMPCTAKKFELSRDAEMYASGFKDVDVVLTTREFARLLKQSGIDFLNLPDGQADSILGTYSGAGVIFANTGGVMEAALRTAYHLVTGKNMDNVEVQPVRGLNGVKEATVDVNGTQVKVAVAHCMGNIEKVLEKVREARKTGKELPYHFIEVMACPGGCIGGGGQPYGVNDEIRKQRIDGIYQSDRNCEKRCSHDNPDIKKIYQDYLGKPGSEKAHHLLHTKYQARPLYTK